MLTSISKLEFNSYFIHAIDDKGIEWPHYALVSMQLENRYDVGLLKFLEDHNVTPAALKDENTLLKHLYFPEYLLGRESDITFSPNLGSVSLSIRDIASIPLNTIPLSILPKPNAKFSVEYPVEEEILRVQSLIFTILNNSTERGTMQNNYYILRKRIYN